LCLHQAAVNWQPDAEEPAGKSRFTTF